MFKKILLALAVVLPMTAAAQKFGTVRVEEIVSAMPEAAAMQTTLSEASKKYETEFQKLQEEVDRLYTEFQTMEKDASTPDAIKERRMQEIQEKSTKMQQFYQTANQDLQRQREQLLTPIIAKVNDAIKSVGQEGSYTFIFSEIPDMILYQGTDVTDLTPMVKAKLGLK